GILEAHPQPAATGLTVRQALEAPPEQAAGGVEHVLDGIEADTADEVNAVRDHVRYRGLACAVGAGQSRIIPCRRRCALPTSRRDAVMTCPVRPPAPHPR